MKRLRIQHHTQYTFGSPVYLGLHRLFLHPREGHDLRIASSLLTISSEPAVTWSRDYYGNVLALLTFDNQVLDAISIASDVEVELYYEGPLSFIVEERAVRFPLSYGAEALQHWVLID